MIERNQKKRGMKFNLNAGVEAHGEAHGAKLTVGIPGLLKIIDTFDRPGDASANSTYARAGTYANGLENKPGKRVPKAGVYAEAGVGEARAEWSVFEAEAKGPNARAEAGVSLVTLNARAFANAEIASGSASAGPLTAKVGLAVDTGVDFGLTGVEVQLLGTGFSFGRKTGMYLFGSGFQLNLL